MSTPDSALVRAMPAVFVLIWSTGFVVARFGMPHAPPMSFLAWRYAISICAFGIWIAWSGAAWPRGRAQWLHLGVLGVLMQAGYLGGVWSAVRAGMGAGLIALIVGLQPIFTALWMSAGSRSNPAGSTVRSRIGPHVRSRVGLRQWLGLLLGLCGLVLVVWHKLGAGQAHAANLGLAVLAMISITAGTLYQKRWLEPCDVRTASTVQLTAALLVTAPLALLETAPVDWQPELIGAMAWSVLALTLGGSSLLYLMIQRGAATAVASLMYLVPPCTALLAWWLFGEDLGPTVLVGLALTAAGVALVVRSSTNQRSRRATEESRA